MSNRTVAAGYTRALLDYAVLRGADRQTLIEISGIAPGELSDPDNRVPLKNCAKLMKAGVSLCGDPAFALRFGETVRTEDLGVALLIAGVAGTVGEARSLVNRNARLIRDDDDDTRSNFLEVVRDLRGAWFQFRGGNDADNQYFVEAGFAWCIRETRKMLEVYFAGRPFLKAIHFIHDQPSYRNEYDRVFAAPLVFASDRNAMLVDEDFLSLPMPGSNPYVAHVLNRHAEVLLQRLENSKTVRGRVEGLLIPSLGTGDISMAAIACKMGVSRQTLFRKLRSEGVTFEKVVDNLRREMAIHYLNEGGTSVSETATLLGFSEPAAFSRAFKRWTGSSPRRASGRL